MSKASRTKNLLDKVRAYVLYTRDSSVTKEELAEKFKAREHEVGYVLHQLNLEGLVGQPIHTTPHGGFGRHGDVSCGCWNRDIYTIRRKDE